MINYNLDFYINNGYHSSIQLKIKSNYATNHECEQKSISILIEINTTQIPLFIPKQIIVESNADEYHSNEIQDKDTYFYNDQLNFKKNCQQRDYL